MNFPGVRGVASLISLSLIAVALSRSSAVAQTSREAKCDNSTVDDFSPSLAPKARAFLADLQTSVKAGDKQMVATMARYPLSVHLNGRTRVVLSRSQLVKDYDHLFTTSMKKAIVSQTSECLFANWQGVMIGDGEVWFEEQRNGSLRIKTLNVPQR
jgi:hypothetical protein